MEDSARAARVAGRVRAAFRDDRPVSEREAVEVSVLRTHERRQVRARAEVDVPCDRAPLDRTPGHRRNPTRTCARPRSHAVEQTVVAHADDVLVRDDPCRGQRARCASMRELDRAARARRGDGPHRRRVGAVVVESMHGVVVGLVVRDRVVLAGGAGLDHLAGNAVAVAEIVPHGVARTVDRRGVDGRTRLADDDVAVHVHAGRRAPLERRAEIPRRRGQLGDWTRASEIGDGEVPAVASGASHARVVRRVESVAIHIASSDAKRNALRFAECVVGVDDARRALPVRSPSAGVDSRHHAQVDRRRIHRLVEVDRDALLDGDARGSVSRRRRGHAWRRAVRSKLEPIVRGCPSRVDVRAGLVPEPEGAAHVLRPDEARQLTCLASGLNELHDCSARRVDEPHLRGDDHVVPVGRHLLPLHDETRVVEAPVTVLVALAVLVVDAPTLRGIEVVSVGVDRVVRIAAGGDRMIGDRVLETQTEADVAVATDEAVGVVHAVPRESLAQVEVLVVVVGRARAVPARDRGPRRRDVRDHCVRRHGTDVPAAIGFVSVTVRVRRPRRRERAEHDEHDKDHHGSAPSTQVPSVQHRSPFPRTERCPALASALRRTPAPRARSAA